MRAAATGAFVLALTGLAPYASEAAEAPVAPQAPTRAGLAAAHDAATAPATLDTLARFFAAEPGAARESGAARRPGGAAPKGAPHIEGAAVPVYVLSPDFVRGRAGAPVARLEFLASKAVAADGRTASVWTVRRGAAWKVVNIAGGDDETRYAKAVGAGTVFHEPQIDAWYVQRGERIEPLDAHARKAVGTRGTTLAAYRERVTKAYGDKLPGSAYDKRGEAGGYGPGSAAPKDAPAPAAPGKEAAVAEAPGGDSIPVTAASAVAGAAALLALGLCGTAAIRRRRSG
ncbi:hypothetical protein SNA_10585 [Streptomyces natalensis ATCC 27448]|uniref:Gram-positive cocci surface proteins LPxTG domain-containing protein n=1 Tax=Streptomyces natalensis ATCC 27448 TaxID=1240678 RepID=A0A0D7CQ45_9ACTN|nr:hypothetical protein SNA_10585 [Streptomyces natalensis ATCC 27448]